MKLTRKDSLTFQMPPPPGLRAHLAHLPVMSSRSCGHTGRVCTIDILEASLEIAAMPPEEIHFGEDASSGGRCHDGEVPSLYRLPANHAALWARTPKTMYTHAHVSSTDLHAMKLDASQAIHHASFLIRFLTLLSKGRSAWQGNPGTRSACGAKRDISDFKNERVLRPRGLAASKRGGPWGTSVKSSCMLHSRHSGSSSGATGTRTS